MEEGKKDLIGSMISTAVKVITKPAGFYREMSKTGGFQDPIIFLVAMTVLAMVVNAIGTIFHFGASPMGFGVGIGSAVVGIIVGPVLAVIFCFIAAAILFVIWKIMGSQENYETAYRCAAYSAGIVPITSVIGFIPYVGSAAGILWGFYLIIIASIEVHKIKSSLAWAVWGIIAALLVIGSLSTQYAAKKFAGEWAVKAKEMEKAAKDMEEAAKKMQESASKMPMPQPGQMTEEQKKQMEEATKQMEELMKSLQKQEKK